jgi:hypothetical protein
MREQQTATSVAPKVASTSPGRLELEFHAVLENAPRVICPRQVVSNSYFC